MQLLVSVGMHEVDSAHPNALDAAYLSDLLTLSPADAKVRFLAAD